VTRYTLRQLSPADKPVVATILIKEWGSVISAARSIGGAVDASTLPGWLAEQDGEVVGLLTYLVRDDTVELVTINAFAGGGIGGALVATLVEHCVSTGIRRIKVTTTNDNTRALRFYQRAGFRLTALHVDAVAEARKMKPEIPELGLDDIPVRDELDLTLELAQP
jgi:ribosomal protein S18 acetylase RimI-like enzyme